jgi:hypothetical protein
LRACACRSARKCSFMTEAPCRSFGRTHAYGGTAGPGGGRVWWPEG